MATALHQAAKRCNTLQHTLILEEVEIPLQIGDAVQDLQEYCGHGSAREILEGGLKLARMSPVCSTLQDAAGHCKTLQDTTRQCVTCDTLQHSAVQLVRLRT